jgi:hypothetical protein
VACAGSRQRTDIYEPLNTVRLKDVNRFVPGAVGKAHGICVESDFRDHAGSPVVVLFRAMWEHNYQPIANSLGLSAVVAAIPIVVLFVMLGALRKPAWISALTALGSAFVLALAAYGMPAQLAVMSALFGAGFGMFPIAWIVFSSIMLYRLAVDTGKFETIKSTIGGLTDDRRLQALFIAFCFGAFIEGAAGFGCSCGGFRRDACRTWLQPRSMRQVSVCSRIRLQ